MRPGLRRSTRCAPGSKRRGTGTVRGMTELLSKEALIASRPRLQVRTRGEDQCLRVDFHALRHDWTSHGRRHRCSGTGSRNLRRWVSIRRCRSGAELGSIARGAFVERLTFEGAPLLAAPRRAMVQGRQIYVFSHAAMLGWWPEGEPSRSRRRTAHRPLPWGRRRAGVGLRRPPGRRDLRPQARFLRPCLRAVRARMGLQARAGAALSLDRARDVGGPRSALRVAFRRLPQCFAGRRRPARAKPAHASLRGHACMERSHRPLDISSPGGERSMT